METQIEINLKINKVLKCIENIQQILKEEIIVLGELQEKVNNLNIVPIPNVEKIGRIEKIKQQRKENNNNDKNQYFV